jgi:hypothetical protein
MPRETKERRLNRIHYEALEEFDDIQETVKDERLQALQDRRFATIAGAQWEGALESQFSNRFKPEDNKIHISVIRIINEYLNNRISVDFQPMDGSEKDALADTCDLLYRNDARRSSAAEAYDNAFEEAVFGGLGAFRLRNEYVDENDPEDERQHICFEPIYDADVSVFFDLQAKKQDKSDAKRCYVVHSMTTKAYRDKYDDDPATWPKEFYERFFDWSTEDVTYIAEFYKVEDAKETIYTYEHLDGTEERFSEDSLNDEKVNALESLGAKQTGEKKVSRKKIHKYLMSGSKVLEDYGYIAGTNIPVIPVYGKRWFIDNIERFMGHVRLAKDLQRLINMQLSKLGEIAALSPIEKPIFVPEQIVGHEGMWSNDIVNNYSHLLINPITDQNGQEQAVGPLAYTRPPAVPPALAALLQIVEEDIKELLGNTQQGEEIQGNISTETAHLISNRLDMQAFIYMSNMAKAIKRCGEIWLGMAKEIYVEDRRKMKGIGAHGETKQIELMRPVIDEKTGKLSYENDLSKAKHEVYVDVGPSSSTRKEATFRSLMRMMEVTNNDQTRDVLSSMAMLNMEGEGIGDTREYFRGRLVRAGVIKPNEEEKKQLEAEAAQAASQIDPQTQYLQSAAINEQAKARKAQADTVYTQARADEARAKTAEILSKMDREDAGQIVEILKEFGPRVVPNQNQGV